MYNCKRCREPIDEYQNNQFNQLCPNCKRPQGSVSISESSYRIMKNSTLTLKSTQLTAKVSIRLHNRWAIFMFIWFGFIGMLIVIYEPPDSKFLGFLIIIIGFIGFNFMTRYMGKNWTLWRELQRLLQVM